MAQKKRVRKTKKRVVKVDPAGQAHIKSSFNNILICFTNQNGDVVSWSSAGRVGFKGSKKGTPYAAQQAARDCSKVALEAGIAEVEVFVKGPGQGRESAIRTIQSTGINVTAIRDVTPVPHNGCRPPKRRKT